LSQTFAAVIGHADEPEMLCSCIAHHLAIGVDRIFVSLNLPDAESERIAREFEGTGRVRAARVESFTDDPFHYFTAAKDAVLAWADPAWMMFVDSDELWTPASGRIHDTAGLDDADLIDVPLFQAPPIREADGSIRAIDTSDLRNTTIAASTEAMDADYLASNPESAVVMAGGSKVLVRPEIVAEVGRGAHAVTANVAEPRRGSVSDLAILHFPFTSRERFRRKVERVRARLALYGHRFGPRQAWHWRRWLEIDDAGSLDAEFDRQLVHAAGIAALRAKGVLATPAVVFARCGPTACER
jgi:hypothetical protein